MSAAPCPSCPGYSPVDPATGKARTSYELCPAHSAQAVAEYRAEVRASSTPPLRKARAGFIALFPLPFD